MIYKITPTSGLKGLTLSPGDIVQMAPGSYPGLDVRGLVGVTFNPGVMVEGQFVNFTGNIKLGNNDGVTFDGLSAYQFKYSGKDFQVFDAGMGDIKNLTVKNFDFGNTATTVFDAQTKIYVKAGQILTYNGDPSTMVFYTLKVDTCKISGVTSMLMGTFEDVTSYHMVNRYLTFNNILVINDGTGFTPKISGASIYDLTVSNWYVSGPTKSTNDCGIIFITGNANIFKLTRFGAAGYIARIINVFLDKPGVSIISYCIDANSTHFGTVDIRIDPKTVNSKAPIPLYGGDFYFLHNTCGDKTDDGSYVTDAVIGGEMKDEMGNESKIVIKDNFAFNAMASGMANNSSLFKNNGVTITQLSNNIDLPPGKPLPTGYVKNKLTFMPDTNSPLINAASDGTDIGATQSNTSSSLPKPIKRSVVDIKIKYVITYDDGDTETLDYASYSLTK